MTAIATTEQIAEQTNSGTSDTSNADNTYILWQLATSPASIVGTITADSLSAAAAYGRAVFGSFHVVAWRDATAGERAAALDADAGERIANGDVCWECGEAFSARQGMPTVCTDCGGSVPTRVLLAAPRRTSPAAAPSLSESWSEAPSEAPIAASWFHTSDGRYFASDIDRRVHQRALDEKAARLAERIRRAQRRADRVEVAFDGREYLTGVLAFLGGAWEAGDFQAFRAALQGDVDPELWPVGINEEARRAAGVRMWNAAAARWSAAA